MNLPTTRSCSRRGRLGWRSAYFLDPAAIGNKHQEHRDNAASNRKDAPQNSLPRRRPLRRVNRSGGRDVVSRPDCNRAVVQIFNASPAGKYEERFVIRLAHKDPFQPVLVGMLQNGDQRIHPALAEIFRTGQRARAMLGQFGQQSSGVPLAIHAAGIGKHRQPRNLIAKAESNVAIVVMAVAIQPTGNGVYLEVVYCQPDVQSPTRPRRHRSNPQPPPRRRVRANANGQLILRPAIR